MADQARFNLAPGPDPKAVAFLEGKGLKRSWRWPSMWQTEHAFGFTLAGVHRLDVLAAAKDLVTGAVRDGTTLETFRDGFEERLKALGFAGPQTVTEFQEGPRDVNLSAGWRTKVIYDTNVRQAYASAEWQAIEDTVADFPALQYHHTEQAHPRKDHLAFDGICLPVTHPFWKTHFPPNGWYCKCWVSQISVGELARGEFKLTTDEELRRRGYDPDPAHWPIWKHEATGREERVPPGVTPGFAFNAGMDRRANLGELLARRVAALDPDMARAAAADLPNLPVFADLVADAVALGQARATAKAAAVAQALAAGSARVDATHAGEAAADRVGGYPAEAWPVAVVPPAMRAEASEAVVVVNASGVGHSADQHPTTPADWTRVQRMLEQGEVWRSGSGDLLLIAPFRTAAGEQTWTATLKPVGGAWRIRTLYPTSPRRRARLIAGRTQLQAGAGPIDFAR
ncbi:phage minor head protein [Phenylobacterium sp.]|uniref:phage head morphogenesis protein n=1 Tax=Phenylobacterium sp. TaxID=1871053 RepID=UPI002F3EF205